MICEVLYKHMGMKSVLYNIEKYELFLLFLYFSIDKSLKLWYAIFRKLA